MWIEKWDNTDWDILMNNARGKNHPTLLSIICWDSLQKDISKVYRDAGISYLEPSQQHEVSSEEQVWRVSTKGRCLPSFEWSLDRKQHVMCTTLNSGKCRVGEGVQEARKGRKISLFLTKRFSFLKAESLAKVIGQWHKKVNFQF